MSRGGKGRGPDDRGQLGQAAGSRAKMECYKRRMLYLPKVSMWKPRSTLVYQTLGDVAPGVSDTDSESWLLPPPGLVFKERFLRSCP